jgi:hypothetical protein
MRTTVRIDDALLRELKQRAQQDGVSLTKLINGVLRRGMYAPEEGGKLSRPYREKTFAMGKPLVNLDKALALAASLEDEGIRDKLERRK